MQFYIVVGNEMGLFYDQPSFLPSRLKRTHRPDWMFRQHDYLLHQTRPDKMTKAIENYFVVLGT